MSHARLYIAPDLASSTIPSELLKNDADIEHFVFDTFGIGEARELQQRAYLRPSVRQTRDFLIHFSNTTTEAQNALLKLFEEPPHTAVFHVTLAREDMLLPTLRSRLLLVSTVECPPDRGVIDSFLSMSCGERMDEIASRTKKKDVAWVQALVAGAEQLADASLKKGNIEVSRSIVFIRQYLGTRGASTKMLLEELALSLPTQK